ncbi:BatA domain-containing protein [Lacipirellula limnantheis]|uniref:Uncharacterized protein n=1 Tax=Lacipirellula limnantheis TaxID=2528024 RepID=A0A517U5R3_9BACT|nr:BatA domain-containing protein [Lacipirellula limnantheis]QDT75972.1 hypothetical protein I41_52170 [Lacipirellula limnantheis]
MGFLTPLLLGGIALIAIPVVLHLVMRQQPRELTFPALRFVKQRRDSNRRKMKLRHWLLLALRCLLIAGLAIALARPTFKGTGLHGKDGAPLAVNLVIDNSLRMEYVQANESRLEKAKKTALELVEKLPEDATVAVCDLGRAAHGYAPDLSAATSRLQNLRPTAEARPLVDGVLESIKLAAEQEDRRQEVFVFTDLSQGAWNDEGLKEINNALSAAPDVRIYIVDVGVADPKNSSLGELQVRRSVLRPGEPLHLEAEIRSNLQSESPLVELSLRNEEGKLQKRSEAIAAFDPQGQGRVVFEIPNLPLGTHQGSVNLAATDPLIVDNTRYFTVEVRPPAKVLLLATQPADALFVEKALGASLGDASRFDVTVKTFADLEKAKLEEFSAVALLDPGPLPAEAWNSLWDFAAGGGGVGIFLGHHAAGELESFNSEPAQRLLPGKLKRVSRAETYLRPRRLDHPALAGLRNYAEELPWQICRVFQYWTFDKSNDSDTYVIAGYANDKPAFIERPAGKGRVLVSTTPFSDPLEPEGREPWNTLPAQPWPFVALVDQLIGYLAQDGDERLDYLAGEVARVQLSPQQQVASYVLHLPDGQAGSRVATSGDDELAVSITDELGNYRLTAGGQSQRLDRGFSVNASGTISDLTRFDPEKLTGALPKDRVRLAENLEAVEQYVDVGRSGRELFPWMIGLVAVIWGAEHLLANRFYREEKGKD